MVSGIFYHHGLSLDGERNKTPYRAYENKDSYLTLRNGENPGLMPFWKGPIGLFNHWCKHIDPLEHKHVYVRRPVEDVADSLIKYGKSHNRGPHRDYIIQNVQIAYNWMDTVRYFCGGVDVNTPKLWEHDYSEIKRAFDYCGLEFDPAIAKQVIDK